MVGTLADEVLFTGAAAVETLLVEVESVAGVASVEISDVGVSAVAVLDVTSVGALETSAAPFPEAKGLDSDGAIDKYFVMSAAGASVVGVTTVEVSFAAVLATEDSSRFAFGAVSVGVLSAAVVVVFVTHSTGSIVAATEFVVADG